MSSNDSRTVSVALEVYRAALESLAKKGSEEAKVALTIAENVGGSGSALNIEHLCHELQQADAELADALYHNGRKWCTETDSAVERARKSIRKALVRLALR